MGQHEVIEFLKENPGWHDAKEIVTALDATAPTNVLKSLERIRRYPVNVKLRQVVNIGSRRKGRLVWIYKFDGAGQTNPLASSKSFAQQRLTTLKGILQ
jgi:hypothetical protein